MFGLCQFALVILTVYTLQNVTRGVPVRDWPYRTNVSIQWTPGAHNNTRAVVATAATGTTATTAAHGDNHDNSIQQQHGQYSHIQEATATERPDNSHHACRTTSNTATTSNNN